VSGVCPAGIKASTILRIREAEFSVGLHATRACDATKNLSLKAVRRPGRASVCRAQYQRFDCFARFEIAFRHFNHKALSPTPFQPIALDAAKQTLAVMIDFNERSAAAVAEFRNNK
jgi:hypothetical protein